MNQGVKIYNQLDRKIGLTLDRTKTKKNIRNQFFAKENNINYLKEMEHFTTTNTLQIISNLSIIFHFSAVTNHIPIF